MTDNEHAEAIFQATKALNDAIKIARDEQGLRVDIKLVRGPGLAFVGAAFPEDPEDIVTTRTYKRLTR